MLDNLIFPSYYNGLAWNFIKEVEDWKNLTVTKGTLQKSDVRQQKTLLLYNWYTQCSAQNLKFNNIV